MNKQTNNKNSFVIMAVRSLFEFKFFVYIWMCGGCRGGGGGIYGAGNAFASALDEWNEWINLHAVYGLLSLRRSKTKWRWLFKYENKYWLAGLPHYMRHKSTHAQTHRHTTHPHKTNSTTTKTHSFHLEFSIIYLLIVCPILLIRAPISIKSNLFAIWLFHSMYTRTNVWIFIVITHDAYVFFVCEYIEHLHICNSFAKIKKRKKATENTRTYIL